MNYGRIAIVTKGNYDPQLSYKKLDFVTYLESSYVAKENILINELPGISSKWQLACKKGDKGNNGTSAYTEWINAGNIGTLNDFFQTFGTNRIVRKLNNPFPSISITPTTVSDLSGISLIADKTYKISLLGTYESLATTTGGKLFFYFSGASISSGFVEMAITPISSSTTLRATLSPLETANGIISTGTGIINTPVVFQAQIIIKVTANGNFDILFGSEIANSQAKMNVPTVLTIEEV